MKNAANNKRDIRLNILAGKLNMIFLRFDFVFHMKVRLGFRTKLLLEAYHKSWHNIADRQVS